MPKQIGDWQLVKEYSMNERAVEVLDCAGYINRQYMNRQTGDMVDVAIITGPGGPISVHIAEVCFSSLAYDITEPRQKVFLSGSNSSKHSFWKVTFRSSNVVADALRVYYGWTTGDAWLASDQPRYDYAPNPILFKLQIAGSIPFEETSDDDPCLIFLQDLMGSDWTVAVK
ncbi:MAG: exosortase-associated EpsI family protein [Pirellulales bacterium]|nr:exosortase-associated EpsI family protein [Pirellulales bacterium]